MGKIGLVAGYGNITIEFAKAAKASGETVIGIGLKGVTQEELANYVDKMHWFEWGQLQKAILVAMTERIRKVVLLGKIKKDILFRSDEKLDDNARSLFDKTKDKKDYALLTQVSNVLAKLGIEIMDSTTYLKHLIPQKGVLTVRQPTKEEKDDIEYGQKIAKELASLDIGQTIAVSNKTALAVEAVEGTDAAIKRAGTLSKIGFTVVKVARPDQDMRFDVPVVGLDTLQTLIDAGGKLLALEGGKTLLIDKDEMIKLANEKGICITII